MEALIVALLCSVIILILIVLLLLNKLINKQSENHSSSLLGEKLTVFENMIAKNEQTIKEEFRLFRNDNDDISRKNREELSKSLESFEKKFKENIDHLNQSLSEKFELQNKHQSDFNRLSEESLKKSLEEISNTLHLFKNQLSERIQESNSLLHKNFESFNKRQDEHFSRSIDSVKDVRETIEKQLKNIREDNGKKLDEMRMTVDEKLQTTLEKRLGDSFKLVSERLEQVHKGLGEMQQIASGVGDLKRVLTNVKTRGVIGEYQLGNILEQILTPEQYSKNVATKKGSQANVEFAVKLPGKEDNHVVWMPIDSKFPIENYQLLSNAYETGEKEQIEKSQKILLRSIESFAKDISSKYIDPPHTTDFAIMFLPVENLYAEVLKHPGLFETLQKKYRITVTGPTTLSAVLSSLQMGFRTLAVQKRSSEVWNILEAVKSEFDNFSKQLELVDKQLGTASSSLQKLKDTRIKAIDRKLRNVQKLDQDKAQKVLELPLEEEEENTEL